MPSRVVDGGNCDCCEPSSSVDIPYVDILTGCCDPGSPPLPVATRLFAEITAFTTAGAPDCDDFFVVGQVFQLDYLGAYMIRNNGGPWHVWMSRLPYLSTPAASCEWFYIAAACVDTGGGVFNPDWSGFVHGPDPADLATNELCGGGGFGAGFMLGPDFCEGWPAVGSFGPYAARWTSNFPSPCGVLTASSMDFLIYD